MTDAVPFDAVNISWKGAAYRIAPDRVMGAIYRIENHVTLAELQRDAQRGTTKLARVSAAFADLLNYAGADGVTASDVYAGMFDGEKAQANVINAIAVLLQLMIPKTLKPEGGKPGEGNRRARRAAASSSKRRTS